jgi:hypothetical protein
MKRYEICWTDLDPTRGAERAKTRRLAEVLSDAEHAWPQVHRDLSAFVGFLDAAIAALG